jgi:hypothetical protein
MLDDRSVVAVNVVSSDRRITNRLAAMDALRFLGLGQDELMRTLQKEVAVLRLHQDSSGGETTEQRRLHSLLCGAVH